MTLPLPSWNTVGWQEAVSSGRARGLAFQDRGDARAVRRPVIVGIDPCSVFLIRATAGLGSFCSRGTTRPNHRHPGRAHLVHEVTAFRQLACVAGRHRAGTSRPRPDRDPAAECRSTQRNQMSSMAPSAIGRRLARTSGPLLTSRLTHEIDRCPRWPVRNRDLESISSDRSKAVTSLSGTPASLKPLCEGTRAEAPWSAFTNASNACMRSRLS